MQIISHRGELATTATKSHLADDYVRRPAVLRAPADLLLADKDLRQPALLLFADEDIRRPPVLLRVPANLPPLAGKHLAGERAAPSSSARRPLLL